MKTIIFAAMLAVAAAVSAANAGELAIDFGGVTARGQDAPEAYAPSRADGLKSAAKAAPKEWTVMVFINGKNNLEIAGLYNVNQMEKIGSTSKMNIVVEIGRMKGQAAGDTDLDGDWTGARRLLIKKDKDKNKVSSPVLQEDKVVDMGDYKRAVDFVKWSKAKFPAKRYMLIVWNHGSGWMDPLKAEKGISFDDETGNYIRTPQIGLILKEAGKVDILAFDACLMNMAEVAFEVKDDAQVIVGSEETVPGLGYPYDLFLGAMAKKPDLSTEDTGAVMVEAFKMFYDALKKGGQLSALRASKLDGLAARISEFAALAKETGDIDALKAARNGVIRYDAVGAASDPEMKISFYGDISQFAQLVAANAKEHPRAGAMKEKAAALRDYIDRELVIDNKATGKTRAGRDLAESKGISVYLPPVETRIAQERLEGIFEGKYTDFAFDKATGWHDFVTLVYAAK